MVFIIFVFLVFFFQKASFQNFHTIETCRHVTTGCVNPINGRFSSEIYKDKFVFFINCWGNGNIKCQALAKRQTGANRHTVVPTGILNCGSIKRLEKRTFETNELPPTSALRTLHYEPEEHRDEDFVDNPDLPGWARKFLKHRRMGIMPKFSNLQKIELPTDTLKWPAHKKLRIKLLGYFHKDIAKAVQLIQEGFKMIPQAVRETLYLTNPASLPKKKKIFTFLRSPFKYKRSREQFMITQHVKVMDIYRELKMPEKRTDPTSSNEHDPTTIRSLFAIALPPSIGTEVRLLDVRTPVDAQAFKDDCFKHCWTSKYFEYRQIVPEKRRLIDELLDPVYDGDRLYDWPTTLYELQALRTEELQNMVARTKQNHEKRKTREAANKQPVWSEVQIFDENNQVIGSPTDIFNLPEGDEEDPSIMKSLRKKAEKDKAEQKEQTGKKRAQRKQEISRKRKEKPKK